MALLLSFLALATLLSGCAELEAHRGKLIGGLAGAGTGAAVGGAIAGGRGAAIGAVAGFVLGLAVGTYVDHQMGDRQAAVEQLKESQASMFADISVIVNIKSYRVEPSRVAPGETAVVYCDYVILARKSAEEMVDLEEWQLVRQDGKDVRQPAYRKMRWGQGIHSSEYRLQLPTTTPPGAYTISTIVRTQGEQQETMQAEQVLEVCKPPAHSVLPGWHRC